MNSRGLYTDPWCTPTLTSNSSLKELFTRVLLLAPTYMTCTTLTNHSGTQTTQRAHHSTFQGALLKVFSKLTKVNFSSRQLFRSRASPFPLHKLTMMLSLQSAGTLPSRMIVFIKSAMILRQMSGAAFNISTTTPEGLAAFPFFMHLRDFNTSSGVMNCARPATGSTCGRF